MVQAHQQPWQQSAEQVCPPLGSTLCALLHEHMGTSCIDLHLPQQEQQLFHVSLSEPFNCSRSLQPQ
jgi:hypothetical protein